ncbi:hypothetical protein Cgig2_004579 [Carnegiea gigantea]|uniref:Uncharacterized protein n=1 Tax=Carnegiea gigantea TaxID=171969 RepID=A0A9Q1JXI6_9CARY|nr:hypothetical protein Cgig2_004579 [Carnegiea gigantea]
MAGTAIGTGPLSNEVDFDIIATNELAHREDTEKNIEEEEEQKEEEEEEEEEVPVAEDLVLGGHKHRHPSTYADTATSTPPTRPFVVKILGREPTIDEIFLYTHTKKDLGEISGDKFVGKRSKDAYIKEFWIIDLAIKFSGNLKKDSIFFGQSINGLLQLLHSSKTRAIFLPPKMRTSMADPKPADGSPMSEKFKKRKDELKLPNTLAEGGAKANEKNEKEIERLKKENKRLKQKANILFEKFNMALVGDSDSDDDED